MRLRAGQGIAVRLIHNYRFYRILAVCWIVMIFWLSSQSDLPTPCLFTGLDKLGHALVFGALGFLFSRSFKLQKGNIPFSRVLVVTLMVAICGGLDEAHQLFVSGRIASIGDIAADTAGGFVSAFMCWRR